jgi:hypothetical protein
MCCICCTAELFFDIIYRELSNISATQLRVLTHQHTSSTLKQVTCMSCYSYHSHVDYRHFCNLAPLGKSTVKEVAAVTTNSFRILLNCCYYTVNTVLDIAKLYKTIHVYMQCSYCYLPLDGHCAEQRCLQTPVQCPHYRTLLLHRTLGKQAADTALTDADLLSTAVQALPVASLSQLLLPLLLLFVDGCSNQQRCHYDQCTACM